jgi:hypothetical protein
MVAIIVGGVIVAGIIGLIWYLNQQPSDDGDVIVEEITIIEERREEHH